jgi:hypothetical protein
MGKGVGPHENLRDGDLETPGVENPADTSRKRWFGWRKHGAEKELNFGPRD